MHIQSASGMSQNRPEDELHINETCRNQTQSSQRGRGDLAPTGRGPNFILPPVARGEPSHPTEECEKGLCETCVHYREIAINLCDPKSTKNALDNNSDERSESDPF